MKEIIIDSKYSLKSEDGDNWYVYEHGILRDEGPEFLYKFYSINEMYLENHHALESDYNIDALKNKYLYLSNPVDFNDPFDCHVNLTHHELHDQFKGDFCDWNSLHNVGICSFSEYAENPIMWGHYTNCFKGFVIKYDRKIIQLKKDDGWLDGTHIRKVIYPEYLKRIEWPHDTLEKIYLVSVKQRDWSYEREWRILAFLKEGDLGRKAYLTDNDQVKEILIGYKIRAYYPQVYQKILNIRNKVYPNVPIKIVGPHKSELRLDFVEVK